MFELKKICFLLAAIYLSSCSNFGATQLGPDRISYNQAMHYSDTQQLLLNIVRLRYTDQPFFLELNNVVSQFSISKALTLDVANSTYPGLLGTANGALSLSESPTLTYTPLQGPEIVKRLMTPLDLGSLYYLMRAGWSVDKVIRIGILSLGPYQNAALASRTAGSGIPVYKDFQRLGLIFRALEHSKNLTVSAEKLDGYITIKLTVKFTSALSVPDRKMLSVLGITPKTPFLFMVSSPTNPELNQYYAETKTAMELCNYLSKGVDVPNEDKDAGYIRRTMINKHQEFDWHEVTKGQIRIRNSKSKPQNAYVSVHYRNRWFYVADNAIYSKETIMILGYIMSSVQGEVKSVLPIFTVS